MGTPHLIQVDIWHIDWNHVAGTDLYNLLRIIIHSLSDLSVPCFFFFSGYLFFTNLKRWDSMKFKQKLHRRVHSLILPYLIWNMIPVMYDLMKALIHTDENVWSSFVNIMNSKGWLHVFWDSHARLGQTGAPEDMPLWFLRDLIILSFILSPIVFFIAKKKAGIFIIIVFFILGMLKIPETEGLSYSSIFWFSIGSYISIHDFPLMSQISHNRYVLISLFTICFVISVLFKGSCVPVYWFHQFSILIGVPIVLLLSMHLSEGLSKTLSNLSHATFFVFASHTIIILPKCRSIMETVTGNNLYLCYLIPPILTVILCTIIYFVFYRLSPQLCKIVNGR